MISFATEQNWDSLEIYDGGDASAPRLGSFSGEVTPSPSVCEPESSRHDGLQGSTQCRPFPGRLFSVLTSFSRVGRLGSRVPDPRVKGKAPSPASRRLMDDHCGGFCWGERGLLSCGRNGVSSLKSFLCGGGLDNELWDG